MIIRYIFLLLCILVPVLTKSTTSDNLWRPVGSQVNDFDAANINLKNYNNIVNNSVSLDKGCDHALNELGGQQYLEYLWKIKSERAKIKNSSPRIGVFGAKFNKGQRKIGVEDGPVIIRQTGFMQELTDDGFNVKDYGNLESGVDSDFDDTGPNGEINYFDVLMYNRMLSLEVKEILSKNDMCMTFGGDHTISMGTVRGHANLNRNHQVKLLWIDAHSDVHSGTSSSSKNMHGMAVCFLLDSLTSNFDDLPNPTLSMKDVVWISLRSVDEPEQKYLDQHKDLKYFTMEDVREQGVDSIIKQSMEWLQPGPESPIHISFDIDALDPTVAPSTGTPVANGLTMDQGREIVKQVYETGYLRALDITEVNPALGTKEDVQKTANAAHNLLVSIASNSNKNYRADIELPWFIRKSK